MAPKKPSKKAASLAALKWPDFTLAPIALPEDVVALLGDHAAHLAAPVAHALAHAWEYSPYLRALMRSRSDSLLRFLEEGPEEIVKSALVQVRNADAGAANMRMRIAKRDVALAVALADLAGLWSLEQVTGALSDLADATLDVAIATAIEERTPGAPVQGFVALALGKHGSRELNYSSDVDLILLYDPLILPHRENESVSDAAQRIARRMVELMQARDAHGYVFRVDLRLRPSPEATPIALPVMAAENYYHSEAEPWERAAFIRARAVAGDMHLGASFFANIRAFVWRRALDYTAIREVESISLRIRDHYEAGQDVGLGYDLKRGRGGIRECEFYAQIHQLIFGGREPHLRMGATMEALAALGAAGRIAQEDAAFLAQAYRVLRTIEHRIQMVADEQTHALPKTAAQAKIIAKLCGLRDWPQLETLLQNLSQQVATIYDNLIAGATQQSETGLPMEAEALLHALKARGFAKPQDIARLIEGWRAGDCRALRTDEARRAFEAVLPSLLGALVEGVDARTTAVRFDKFVRSLPSGVQFFAMLEANPALVPLLGRLLSLSPFLADALARTPELFDVMLDPQAFAPLPDSDALIAELQTLMRGADYEDILDRTRRWTAERRFQIGAQLIEGHCDPLLAARNYARLADAAMLVLVAAVEEDYARTHGYVAGGHLLVLGLGRYGGGALTAKSDLDLIYLFTGTHDALSDGAKPLPATSYFNRLCQRLTAALSVPTAAGALYDIDTRLRPSGTQGLLAASLESFVRYQRDEAWTFEHMALTRARVVAGDAATAAMAEKDIAALLSVPRAPEKLWQDIVSLRRDMEAAKPGGGLWDVKLGAGGLVDLEFIVQYQQLRTRSCFANDLHETTHCLAQAGLVSAALVDAHDLMSRLLILLRLMDSSGDLAKAPHQVQNLLARGCGYQDFAALQKALAEAKAHVQTAWEAAFGGSRGKEKQP